ncbi:MAG: SDR family NAD(P)-dependent oxidoreductase [Anaerolineales bacterium]
MLFSACLFPFITAFIGDYPSNPFVVAIYPLNMALSSLILGKFWKYAFVETDLAPNKLTDEEKEKTHQPGSYGNVVHQPGFCGAGICVGPYHTGTDLDYAVYVRYPRIDSGHEGRRMKDKIILITGATSGIGFQTALALAKMGAQVITGRSQKTAEEAVQI